MSSKTIIPQLIFKRKGNFNTVMVQLHSLDLARPGLTAGEMADALNRITPQDIQKALNDKAATR